MRWVAAVALLVLSGCAHTVQGCTAVGSVHGVMVKVDPAVGRVVGMKLRVCGESGCQALPASYFLGGDGEPEAVFSQGEIAAGPVRVSGSYRVGHRRIALAQVTSRAVTSYPNGRNCGADGTVVKLTLTTDGLESGIAG